jgi:hypothetical protein
VEIVLFGFPLQDILSMDMVSFNSLHGSIARVKARQKEEDAWTQAVCSQGDIKTLKKLTKAWLRAAEIGPEDDGEELLKRFGSQKELS